MSFWSLQSALIRYSTSPVIKYALHVFDGNTTVKAFSKSAQSICTENPRDHKGSGRPFFANFKEGLVENFFENNFPQNRWFERKSAHLKIFEIIWDHVFSFFKNADFDENIGFFDLKSRSRLGGFPYKYGEFMIETTKGIEVFERIWVKSSKIESNQVKSTFCSRWWKSRFLWFFWFWVKFFDEF